MPVKIVVACDKYKGNISAQKVCKIIRDAIYDIDKRIEVLVSPMADGGEGTVDTIVESYGGRYIYLEVNGPVNDTVKAKFGVLDKTSTVIIEMSAASGLWLLPEEKRDPMNTTTFGTGQLIKKAFEIGCKKIIIGIGGSATNDAGMGMAQALGARFYDESGKILGMGGKQLEFIRRIDVSGMDPSIKSVDISVACDVDNPLYGKNGAAFVYGPQKGADRSTVALLDRGLVNFADIVKKDLGKDISEIKGGGAAGGLGAGLVAFLDAKLLPGADLIIDLTGLTEKIKNADLVITGEGAMDEQTYSGKSGYGVAKTAKKYGVPVITINGSVDVDYNKLPKNKLGLFSGNFDTINKIMTLDEAISHGGECLFTTAREIIKFYLATVKRFEKKGDRRV